MANPTTASSNDEAYTTAMANYYIALGNKDARTAEYWYGEMKRLKDNKGGELAQDMGRGQK
jgi:hypothetical protein